MLKSGYVKLRQHEHAFPSAPAAHRSVAIFAAPFPLHARRPGPGRAPLRLPLRRPVLQLCKFLARREDFSRSAAVCAAHQPQRVVRTGRLPIQPVPAGFRGRCGWSSADTAALLGLRLRRPVFIISLWFTCLGWSEWLRLTAALSFFSPLLGAPFGSPRRHIPNHASTGRSGGFSPLRPNPLRPVSPFFPSLLCPSPPPGHPHSPVPIPAQTVPAAAGAKANSSRDLASIQIELPMIHRDIVRSRR